MPHDAKIATCCYCGARSVLTAQAGRHSLACASCGAPLAAMKWLKPAPERQAMHKSPRTAPPPQDFGIPSKAKGKKKSQKPRKPLWAKALGEVFDAIEDIID